MINKQFFVFTYFGGFKKFSKDFDSEIDAITHATKLKDSALCDWSEVLDFTSGKTVFKY